jgi:hypothetical protein
MKIVLQDIDHKLIKQIRKSLLKDVCMICGEATKQWDAIERGRPMYSPKLYDLASKIKQIDYADSGFRYRICNKCWKDGIPAFIKKVEKRL